MECKVYDEMNELDHMILWSALNNNDLTQEFLPTVRLNALVEITRSFNEKRAWFYLMKGYEEEQITTDEFIQSVFLQCCVVERMQ